MVSFFTHLKKFALLKLDLKNYLKLLKLGESSGSCAVVQITQHGDGCNRKFAEIKFLQITPWG